MQHMIDGSCLCGAARWTFSGQPDGATACNCTGCRRYGVLWAYDYENEDVLVTGPTRSFVRGKALEFHFCPTCGCVIFWRGVQLDERGRRRMAVNLRLAEPEAVAQIPIDHFDGLETFATLADATSVQSGGESGALRCRYGVGLGDPTGSVVSDPADGCYALAGQPRTRRMAAKYSARSSRACSGKIWPTYWSGRTMTTQPAARSMPRVSKMSSPRLKSAQKTFS